MSPTTRIVLFNFWEYAAFLANSFIFLLIGLSIDLPQLFQNGRPILWAIGAVLVARAVMIYGLSWAGHRIPFKWMHILNWGGLRGAISLALALSLPATLEARDSIQVMAFGVVLFTLLVQGFTMEPLVRRLRLVDRSPAQDEYERRHARAVSGRSGYEEVRRQYQQGLLSEHTWRTLAPILEDHNQTLADAVREILSEHPDLEAEELDTARREALRAQRSSLYALYKDRVISEEVFTQLASEVDAGLTDGLSEWPELVGGLNSRHAPINRLTAAVIQEQDIENAVNALTKLGLTLTTLPSSGAFLRRRNAIFLIGLADGQEEALIRALQVSCRRRVEYPSAPLVELVPGLAKTTPVTVCGTAIFTLEVERFEVF
jgi:NhaP-type Na+/H+ or K+/H+ antiporter